VLANNFSATRRRLAAITAIIVLLVVAAAPTMRRAWAGEKGIEDFAPTYWAARAMWNGQDIYKATDRLYLYSPFVAFIFQPIAAGPEYRAAVMWAVLSAVLIAAASIIASKEIVKRWRLDAGKADVSLPWLIAAVALLLSFDKLRAEFRLIQIDALLFFGFASILVWMDRKPSLAALMVGITANIKYLSLIFVPYFIIKRQYRAAAISIVSFAFFMILPAIEIGPRLAGGYAVNALAALAKLANLTPRVPGQGVRILPLSWDRSVSFTSAIFRAANSYRLSDFVAAALVVVGFAAVVGTIIFIGRRQSVCLLRPDAGHGSEARGAGVSLEWAVLIVVALIFSPQTMARHMVLLSLVYTVAIGIFIAHKERRLRILLIVATVVAVAGLSLPFRAFGLDNLLQAWRAVSGASWCAFLLSLAVSWAGSSAISEMTNKNKNSRTALP
jgi:hypothetical protein